MSLDLNDAAMSGNAEEVLIRLNMGEDPNQKFYPRFRSANGFSKSLVCCGRQEVVRILLERGANVNELDYKNSTPLRLAIRYGQDEIETLLRAKGAKESVENPQRILADGETVPQWVRKSSRREQTTSL